MYSCCSWQCYDIIPGRTNSSGMLALSMWSTTLNGMQSLMNSSVIWYKGEFLLYGLQMSKWSMWSIKWYSPNPGSTTEIRNPIQILTNPMTKMINTSKTNYGEMGHNKNDYTSWRRCHAVYPDIFDRQDNFHDRM